MSSRIAMVGCNEQQSKTTKRKFYFLAFSSIKNAIIYWSYDE